MEKEIIKPTYAIAGKIFLVMLWQQLFFTASLIIIGCLVYLILNFLNTTLGAYFLNFFTISALLSLIIFMPFYVMQHVLKRKFKNFSLMTFQRSTNNEEALETLVQSTYKIALKFWWAIFWRSILLECLLILVIGIPLGFYFGFTGLLPPEMMFDVLGTLSSCLGFVYIIKTQLNKKFKTFSIYTVANKTEN